jgi:aminopeptidase N
VGVTGEVDGGDNWWPCKDHPSDEPDEGMDISLTVPQGLVGLSNGRPLGERTNGDGTVTTLWRVGHPINNYGVSVAVGPFVPVEATYHGVDGERDEVVVFWAIPESVEDARRMWAQTPQILQVLGRRFGEYPFFSDKLWAVQMPYLGMEHQTLIAYGGEFQDNEFGFDAVLLHELAHEWWGNKVTASDWADVWLHEGFATYAEALYVLDTLGEDRYRDYMQQMRDRITNTSPVIRGADLTASEVFSADVYAKGAWVLHMLRMLAGEDRMSRVLWRFADGDNPSACRFTTTDEFIEVVGDVTQWQLDWFWQRYLSTAALPEWTLRRVSEGALEIRWNDPAFEMPLPVQFGEIRRLVAMPGGRAKIPGDRDTDIVVDPDNQVLTVSR